MPKILGRNLYDYKKWEHKQKEDQGKAFGKSFDYQMGKKKAKEIAAGRLDAKRKEMAKKMKS